MATCQRTFQLHVVEFFAQSRPSAQPTSAMPDRTAASRRGLILLVLLGVLALFGATAFAFVVVASHANRITKSLQELEQARPLSPEHELETALLQVVRGPGDGNTSSALRRHSLLEDMYGGEDAWVRGWVVNRFTLAPRGSGSGNPKGLHNVMLPGTPMPSNTYADMLAGGQIIEFTAGYTVPQYRPIGGLDPYSGTPTTMGISAPETLTLPSWFGEAGHNYDEDGLTAVRNDAIEFCRRVGAILTIVDPNSVLFNKSARIIGYRRVEVPDKATRLAAEPVLPIDVVYHRYQILPFEGVSAEAIRDYFRTTQYRYADYIINGTPFSGTGAGYDPETGRNDAAYLDEAGFELPYALLPNTTDPDYHGDLVSYSANEDYDAPDYQNMLLAMEESDGSNTVITRSPSLHRPALANYWMKLIVESVSAPSLADKLRLLIQPYGKDGVRNSGDEDLELFSSEIRDAVVTIKRRCLLRPIPELHYAFDGSNPNWPPTIGASIPQGNTAHDLAQLQILARQAWGVADLVPGQTAPWSVDADSDGLPDREVVPWDVDNDGDGIPDSVWVDIGLPIRASRSGYMCKPLVAIHCVDLDGKVNLNTVGSNDQLYSAYHGTLERYATPDTVYAQVLTEGRSPSEEIHLARGQGCGTAEISALPIIGFGDYPDYSNLLLGIKGAPLDGRYGEVRLRRSFPENHVPAPGRTEAMDSPEELMLNQLRGFPPNYWQAVAESTATGYGSPMDLKGTLAVGLDFFGQPIYSVLRGVPTTVSGTGCIGGWNFEAWNLAHLDTPYELKLGLDAPQAVGPDAALDNPFTVAEYERLARPYDVDFCSLPDRLHELLGAGNSTYFRLRSTTESWDLPVPNLALPPNLRNALPVSPLHTTDLIAAKLLDLHANHRDTLPGSTYFFPEPKNVDMSVLLTADVLAGLRLDLNRPFGDGADNNRNHIVDEPGEAGDAATSERQAFARSLFVLMMALVEPEWYPPWDEEVQANQDSPTVQAVARARAIAQWAINIVDFRDPDSIMTPFVYDPYPFAIDGSTVDEFPEGIDRESDLRGRLLDTWNVDGTDRRVVWGCERPELLITETLAFHDRRTEDTDDDPSGQTVAGGDNDFDQRYPPEGSLFVELYNPWTDSEPGPSEFHCDHSTDYDAGGVILNQLTLRTPASRRVNPVWRLVVTKTVDSVSSSYTDPDRTKGGHAQDSSTFHETDVERIIYFVPESTPDLVLPDRQPPFHTVLDWVTFVPRYRTDAVIKPHRYCVVGPGAETRDEVGATTSGITYVGTSDESTPTRRIELNPTETPQVRIFGNGVSDVLDGLSDAIHPPSAFLIDQVITTDGPVYRRLSVSEPLQGYAPAVWDSSEMAFKYTPPLDCPEDKTDENTWREPSVFDTDGTIPAYCYVHLQRIANPTQPYDPDLNPYLTIDSAPVDLTVFNGRDASQDVEIDSGTWAFNSRQRGEDTKSLWAVKLPASDDMPQGSAHSATLAGHVFDEPFNHTLGYVNSHFGNPLNPGVFGLYGSKGAPGKITYTELHERQFHPNVFAWLTWLNRPFATPLELLQVPAARSSRLLVSYEDDAMGLPNLQSYQSGQQHFAHLLDFFGALPGELGSGQMKGSGFSVDPESPPPTCTAPHAYRLFEYVRVPSRFVDTKVHTNSALMSDPDDSHAFHPPFNLIPKLREPGKLNLNTIFANDGRYASDSMVWWGLLNDHNTVSWESFVNARRGYTGSGSCLDTEPVPLPTRMANPFRSFAGVDLVPPIPGRDPEDGEPCLTQIVQEGVNATLLRAAVGTAGPLETLDLREPMFANTADKLYADTEKTPFFRYQSLQRLSNLTTTRSNVYAIWITIGYFYVIRYPDYSPDNQLHRQLYSDGYSLGKEVGIHDGTVIRHRAFYMVDRSVPVGFIPGQDLNTEDTILLRRFIE